MATWHYENEVLSSWICGGDDHYWADKKLTWAYDKEKANTSWLLAIRCNSSFAGVVKSGAPVKLIRKVFVIHVMLVRVRKNCLPEISILFSPVTQNALEASCRLQFCAGQHMSAFFSFQKFIRSSSYLREHIFSPEILNVLSDLRNTSFSPKCFHFFSETFICTKTLTNAAFIRRINASQLHFRCETDVFGGMDKMFAFGVRWRCPALSSSAIE